MKINLINHLTSTKSTITNLLYIPELKSLLISESFMHGFDWTGQALLINETELIKKQNYEYALLAYKKYEYEFGCTTSEFFNFSSENQYILSGCMNGTIYSSKLNTDKQKENSEDIFMICKNDNSQPKEIKCEFDEILYEHSDIISKILKNPYNNLAFCSTSWDSQAQFWQFSDSKIEFVASQNLLFPIYDFCYLNENCILACSGNASKSKLSIIDSKNNLINPVFSYDCGIRKINKISPNLIGTCCDNGNTLIFDINDLSKPLLNIEPIFYEGRNMQAHCICENIGKMQIFIGYDHFIRLFDLKLNKEIWKNEEKDTVNSICMLNEKNFVYSTLDGNLYSCNF